MMKCVETRAYPNTPYGKYLAIYVGVDGNIRSLHIAKFIEENDYEVRREVSMFKTCITVRYSYIAGGSDGIIEVASNRCRDFFTHDQIYELNADEVHKYLTMNTI